MPSATAENKKTGVLLLGHGSRLKEANETLKEAARRVEAAGGYGMVSAAYLQMASPTIGEGIDAMAEAGFKDIVVMPYFLYAGAHVTEDIPKEIEEARVKHPGLNVAIAPNLGMHDKLIEITVERIAGVTGAASAPQEPSGFVQHPIEKESFRILSKELGDTAFGPLELPVVKRVIHTTADFEFKDLIAFSPQAVASGMEAIRNGCNVVADVKMVEAGITRDRIGRWGSKLLCFSADEDVVRAARTLNITKTSASMRKAADHLDGGIAVIGNAPTALAELLKLIRMGQARPALVIGVPVGFVGAVEAKDELMRSGVEYISVRGRKGGSTVAVAIVNAIAIMALEPVLKEQAR